MAPRTGGTHRNHRFQTVGKAPKAYTVLAIPHVGNSKLVPRSYFCKRGTAFLRPFIVLKRVDRLFRERCAAIYSCNRKFDQVILDAIRVGVLHFATCTE